MKVCDMKNLQISAHESIVILEIGGLGDFIMATPTLRKIRERYSVSDIRLFVAERTVPLAETFSQNILSKPFTIVPFRTTGNFFLRNVKNLLQIQSIARKKPDILIDLSAIESKAAADRRKTFIHLFHSRKTAGRNTDKHGDFYTVISDEILFSKQHEVDRKYNVLRALGMEGQPDHMDLYIDDTARKQVDETLMQNSLSTRTLIGINTGAYRSSRRWPVKNIIEMIASLTAEDRHFILFGGLSDTEFVKEICRHTDSSGVTLIVGEPFQTVGAWLKRCHLFITNDTGLMHFAAALRIPTVALFGPENPYRYGPWGTFPKNILKHYPENREIFTESAVFSEDSITQISQKTVTEVVIAFLETGKFT